jgi:PAS domain-containing protein
MSLQPTPKQDTFRFPVSNLSSSTVGSMLFTMEQIGLGVAYWDFDNQMIYWSKKLAELCGLRLGDFHPTYQDYLRRVHPDDRFELRDLIEQVKTTLEVGQIEYRVLVNDQERWLRSRFSPGVENGRLTHITEVVSNVSDLKSAQQALINSETRWRKLSSCISDVLIETTFSGEIISTADSIVTHWGYLPDELRGSDLLSLVEFEEGYPLNPSEPIDDDFVSVAVTVNFLHKRYDWKTTKCSIYVDSVRQTLHFIFKPLEQTDLSIDARPQLRAAITTITNALVYRYPLTAIYAKVSEIIAYSLQADCVHIYRHDSEEALWRNVYDYRQQSDFPCAAGVEFPEQDNCISHLLKQSQPVQLDYWEACGSDPDPDFIMQFAGFWMVLPIQINANHWGAILVIRFEEMQPWTEQEFNQAILFGDYINMAIAAQHS